MQRWSASREASTEYGDVYVFCELEEDPTGDYVRYEDYKAALAEAERTIVELRGAAEADEQRLRDAAACAGVGWFGCDTPEVLADTIAELRAALRTKGESLDVCEAARADELLLAVSALMKAFDDGIFVRDTSNDHRPDWAIRLFNPLRALAVLREASDAALRDAKGE